MNPKELRVIIFTAISIVSMLVVASKAETSAIRTNASEIKDSQQERIENENIGFIDNKILVTPTAADTIKAEYNGEQTLGISRTNGGTETANIILFSRLINGQYDLYLLDLKNKTETQITNTPNANEMNARVSPNGEYILYAINIGPSQIEENYVLQAMNLKTKRTKVITVNDKSNWDGVFSPFGDKIFFKLNALDQGDIHSIDIKDSGDELQATNLRNLTPAMPGEQWKPEVFGNYIYFTSGTEPNEKIMRMDLNGENIIELTSGWYPSINSEDGRLAFTKKDETGFQRIYILDTTKINSENINNIKNEGLFITKVTNQPNGSFDNNDVAWIKTSDMIWKLVFISTKDGDYDLYLLDPSGKGEATEIGKENTFNELSPEPIGSASTLPNF